MNNVFFIRAEETQFGSFHYPLGLIETSMSDSAWAFFKEVIGGVQPTSVDEQDEDALVHLAYEITSLFHEMRHFFDTFGTLAGLSLFSGRLTLLKEFVALADTLLSMGMGWQLPLSTWALAADCPKEIRDFVRRARAFDISSEIYIAPFDPIEIDGHRDDMKIELDYARGGKADAFPLRITLINEEGETESRTVLFPLGLEALLEGSAHTLCRNLVDCYFPESVAQRLQHRVQKITVLDEHGQTDQRAAQTSTPYMVCDLLITRFFQRHGIEQFPRDLILELIDRALSTSFIRMLEPQPGMTAMYVERVGARLVNILESEDFNVLVSGATSDESEVMEAYEGMLANLEEGGEWQSIEDDHMPASSIAIWETYMAKSFIVPLFRQRLATGHRAFRSHDGFLEMLSKIGLPPARVVNGKLMLGVMPPRVGGAWLHCLMLGEVMRQLVRGSGSVFCPRAHETVPGITTINFAYEGDCQSHRRLGCGTFRVGQPAGIVPKCLFEDTMRVCALKR
ncbi:MAG: hypothetical protein ACJ76Y_02875 [Thermoanaerobaculia bacterium]